MDDDCQMTIQSDSSETDMIRDVESYREHVGMLLMYVYSYVCRAHVGKSMYILHKRMHPQKTGPVQTHAPGLCPCSLCPSCS